MLRIRGKLWICNLGSAIGVPTSRMGVDDGGDGGIVVYSEYGATDANRGTSDD